MPRKALYYVLLPLLITGLLIVAFWPTQAARGDPSPSPTMTASPTASGSPSPSPTASPSPPPPACSATVAWAHKWQRAAKCRRARLDFALRCLRRHPVAALPVTPLRSACESDWHAYGASCKRLAGSYMKQLGATVYRMAHPHPLVSASQWRGLLLWVGWPKRIVPYALVIIRRESGGRPDASNGICDGLFQINRCHGLRHPFDPKTNVTYAWYLLRCVHHWYPTWVTARDAPAWAEP